MEPLPSKFISFLAIAVLLASFSPPCIHARDIQYFSKATHTTTTPTTTVISSTQLNKDPSTTTTTTTTPTEQDPSSAAVTEQTAEDQHGYGLYGQQSNYQYSPTTSNPTKETTTYYDNQGRAIERQGMSDTRFLENGKYYHDISNEVNNNNNNNNDKFEFNNNMQNYQAEDEDEEEGLDDQDKEQIEEEDDGHGKLYNFENNNNNNKYYSYNGAEERQGLSDTRYLENGRYYYGINKDKKSYNSNDNGFQRFSYGNKNNNGYSAEEEVTGYRNSYPKQGKNPFDFRNTENKFPEFEFDSMEEYEKYQEQRAKQNGYRP